MIFLIASIPSPSSGALHLGSLQLRAYGLMIGLGVVAGVYLSGRRFEQRGIGTRDDMWYIAMWAVPAGVIGSRLYHVATDFERFRHDPAKVFAVWEGGLGIPGGVLAGSLVGIWAARRRGLPISGVIDACAPALPLSQAIGRVGNYFNQELFGRATTLPWGLRIDADHVPPGYAPGTLFHPTFLYEALWNLALCGLLLVIDRRYRLRPGRLFAVYVMGYGVGRYWIEGLRIDPAKHGGGLRLNQWMAVVIVVAAAVYAVADAARHRHDDAGLRIVEAHDEPLGALGDA